MLKERIYRHFADFATFDDLPREVSVRDNFDRLLIPTDHPSRRTSDTYHVDTQTVLRTHTSAHQNQLLEQGHARFLVTGDVYRKDEIDAQHYPVFHQMEGVCLVSDSVDPERDLQDKLTALLRFLFPAHDIRFHADFFSVHAPIV